MRTRVAGAIAGAAVLVLAGGTAAVAGQKVSYDSAKAWSELTGVECTKMEFRGQESDTYIALEDSSYVVVKGGSTDAGNGPGISIYEGVEEGDVLMAPSNDKNGKPSDISWVIDCDGYYPGS